MILFNWCSNDICFVLYLHNNKATIHDYCNTVQKKCNSVFEISHIFFKFWTIMNLSSQYYDVYINIHCIIERKGFSMCYKHTWTLIMNIGTFKNCSFTFFQKINTMRKIFCKLNIGKLILEKLEYGSWSHRYNKSRFTCFTWNTYFFIINIKFTGTYLKTIPLYLLKRCLNRRIKKKTVLDILLYVLKEAKICEWLLKNDWSWQQFQMGKVDWHICVISWLPDTTAD